MRIHVSRSRFARRPFRNTLIGVGVIGVIALAAIGAVVGLVLLAAGALVHFSLRGLRNVASPATRDGVIEGEYKVVDAPARRLLTR